MAKTKAKITSKSKSTVPSMKFWLTVSVAFNAVILVSLFCVAATPNIDQHAVVNHGVSVMCSNSFRKNHVKEVTKNHNKETGKTQGALLDFVCARGDGQKYFIDGFNAYLTHLGMHTVGDNYHLEQ